MRLSLFAIFAVVGCATAAPLEAPQAPPALANSSPLAPSPVGREKGTDAPPAPSSTATPSPTITQPATPDANWTDEDFIRTTSADRLHWSPLAMNAWNEAKYRHQRKSDLEKSQSEQALQAEARKRCRWENDPAYEVTRAPGTQAPIYKEQYAGNWRSKPVCEKGTSPDVLQAADRIAQRLAQPTP